MKPFAVFVLIIFGLVASNFIKIGDAPSEPTLSGPQEAISVSGTALRIGHNPISSNHPASEFNKIAKSGPTSISICEEYGGFPHNDFSVVRVEQPLTDGVYIGRLETDNLRYLAVGFGIENNAITLFEAIVGIFFSAESFTPYACLYPIA